MREKLSLPIGIRGLSGSAKAPPAARSDNALRKMRRAAHTEQGRTTRRGRCAAGGKDQPAGIVRRAGKINPQALRGGRRTRIRAEPPARALRGGREKSTRGHCAAGGKNQPAGVVRKKGAERPRRAEILFLRSLALCRAFIAPCRSRQRGSRRPSRRSRGRSRLSRRARAHKKNGAEAPFFCCLFTPWNR